MENNSYPTLAWFSCGVTSAIACKLALKQYKKVRLIYIETGSHHPDSLRFLKDCENWYGQKIEIHRSLKYSSHFDVIERKHFINSPYGAPCTLELKKKVRYSIEDEQKNWHGQIFGFDYCSNEIKRAERFLVEYPKAKAIFPLIEKQLTKQDCMGMLLNANIKIPMMYKLGYKNNNCIGCVKGSMSYWNHIRKDFPSTFNKMAVLERKLKATCLHDANGNIYLDQLDPQRGLNENPLVPECSIYCQLETMTL